MSDPFDDAVLTIAVDAEADPVVFFSATQQMVAAIAGTIVAGVLSDDSLDHLGFDGTVELSVKYAQAIIAAVAKR